MDPVRKRADALTPGDLGSTVLVDDRPRNLHVQGTLNGYTVAASRPGGNTRVTVRLFIEGLDSPLLLRPHVEVVLT